ncbi:MAG: GntR family transcriptional regulator [Armatimonadia bacterium]
MPLAIDQTSPVPIYAQLIEQLRLDIAAGRLAPGEQLPTVRQLAVDLRVNMHTVAHAYAELAREGLIAVRRGVGTIVVGPPAPPQGDERARKLADIIQNALGQAAALGLTPEEFVSELDTYLRRNE